MVVDMDVVGTWMWSGTWPSSLLWWSHSRRRGAVGELSAASQLSGRTRARARCRSGEGGEGAGGMSLSSLGVGFMPFVVLVVGSGDVVEDVESSSPMKRVTSITSSNVIRP